DRSAFENLTSKLVEQFDGEVPSVLKEAGIESNGVNGEFTLGENIGDLGGLGISVVAYRMYCEDKGLDINGQKAKFDIEGGSEELAAGEFTGLQRLFLAWARVWRTAIRSEMAKQYLAMDPHSPAEFRCNMIAANIAEFYEALDVAEDETMFLEAKNRGTRWQLTSNTRCMTDTVNDGDNQQWHIGGYDHAMSQEDQLEQLYSQIEAHFPLPDFTPPWKGGLGDPTAADNYSAKLTDRITQAAMMVLGSAVDHSMPGVAFTEGIDVSNPSEELTQFTPAETTSTTWIVSFHSGGWWRGSGAALEMQWQ